ncbi:unnamed protein product [Ceutorhynchus assimilis]|uniref:E3 SUMO-protein ligase NSE2 n=1 Tax=Ceutorhynchus assimilis TaxID=467358 RepID=A0A9N9MHK7_9CUCU|nr:unnamed protein product [Ceutorhynchus assimilis]
MSQDRYASKFEKCTNILKTYQEILEKYPDDNGNEIKEFEDMALDHCKSSISFEKSMNAIRSYGQDVSENGPEKDHNVAKSKMQVKLAEAEAEAKKENPKNHHVWREIFSKTQDIEEVPSSSKRKNKKEAVYEQLDDSIMCSTSFTAPIDPISKLVIKQPVRNTKCNHVYDKKSIYDYITQSKKRARCPYVACENNALGPQDLIEDCELEDKISQYLSTQPEQESSGSSPNEDSD